MTTSLWPNKLIIIVIFQITWRHELKTIICLISSVLWSSTSEAWSAGPPQERGLGRSPHLPPADRMCRMSWTDRAKKAVKLTYIALRSAQFPSHGSKDKMLIALRCIQHFGSFCLPYILITAFTLLARVHNITPDCSKLCSKWVAKEQRLAAQWYTAVRWSLIFVHLDAILETLI